MDNCNYPRNDDNAFKDTKLIEELGAEVTVSLTLSKTLKIKVPSYLLEDHNDTNQIFKGENDISKHLKSLVMQQIVLPQEAWMYIQTLPEDDKLINDIKNWDVDDFEVVLE